jgi:hypothetical protein
MMRAVFSYYGRPFIICEPKECTDPGHRPFSLKARSVEIVLLL